MAYEFRKTYKVASEAGCDISSDSTIEAISLRMKKVKEWFDSTFSDIFETGNIVEENTSNRLLRIYFKGTNNGIYIRNSSGSANGCGTFTNDREEKGAPGSTAKLGDNNVNLLVIKSKYGFITGFYLNNIGDAILSLVINGGTRLISLIFEPNKQGINISDGASSTEKFNVMVGSNSSEVCLTQYCPARTDYIPEGIYMNQCAGIKDCAVYTVGSGSEKYAEIQGANGYITLALKLEEPTEADYEGIKPLRASE